MKMKSSNKITVLLFWILAITGLQNTGAQTRSVFQENFTKQQLSKKWNTVNGDWQVKEGTVIGTRNKEWAILVSNKTLPENYILTFSTLVDPNAYLFEVIANLHEEKYVGILLNQLEDRVAIEDRSLYKHPATRYIESTGNIGKLPKVKFLMEYRWLDWKIQKAGNQLFVWLNNEAVIVYTDTAAILKAGGKFGFAVNGAVTLKNIALYKTKKEAALPPADFQMKNPFEKPFFLFSE